MQHPELPEMMRDFEAYVARNPFMAYNHIEIVSASPQRSVVQVRLTDESMNLQGAVHGGLIYSMADCVAGICARAEQGETYVTQSSHISFLRNVTQGTIYASAETIKRGRRVIVSRISVYTEDGTLLADGSIEMMKRG